MNRCPCAPSKPLSALAPAAVLLALVAPGVAPAAAAGDGPPPSQIGQWVGPEPWPVEAIHAFVLPTGKVLHFSHPGPDDPATFIWNPATDSFTVAPVQRPIFCSGHAYMPDGRLLVAGGTQPGGGGGLPDTHVFDPFTETWTRVQDMSAGRFYPSVVAMPQGRMLALSGLDGYGDPNPQIAFYDPAPPAGWHPVAEFPLPLYPWTHLLNSGAVLAAGPAPHTVLFSPAGQPQGVVAETLFGARRGGVSVLLPPDRSRVLIAGGIAPDHDPSLPTASAEILDVAAEQPTWRYTQPMHFPRVDANPLILPDGSVLIVGGAAAPQPHGGPPEAPVLAAERFDPLAEQWQVMDAMQIPRLEHATAVLLPDGRVLAGGGNGSATVEFFHPPYLFAGPRPVIEAAPRVAAYGAQFLVSVSGTADVGSVVLLRPSSATHWVNMDQRYVELSFSPAGGGSGVLAISSPASPAAAPPGFYMLFVLDGQGVPSVARMIRLMPGPIGDLDGDGAVGTDDVLLLLAAWGPCPPPPQTCAADLNGNGHVGIADLLLLLGNWG